MNSEETALALTLMANKLALEYFALYPIPGMVTAWELKVEPLGAGWEMKLTYEVRHFSVARVYAWETLTPYHVHVGGTLELQRKVWYIAYVLERMLQRLANDKTNADQ